ncbi:MAG: desulfoferrodoxin FeS4 iron-binding domain-containing protein, partial [Bacteroidales bacterium]
MTELNQIYKCSLCGNMTEVIHPSGGTLVCCGQPMSMMKENNTDASTEKHVPVITKIEG